MEFGEVNSRTCHEGGTQKEELTKYHLDWRVLEEDGNALKLS